MSNTFDPFDAEPGEMPPHRDIDDAAAERLLDGVGQGPVHDLLMAARAAGRTEELAGEAAAVMAFRRATSAAPRSHARRPMLRRLVAVKVGAVALATVLGGVAIAATTGVLPLPFGPDAPAGSTQPPPTSWTAPGSSGQTGSSPITGTPPVTPPPPGTVPPGQGPTPATALPGLCRAYLAHVAAKPDEQWDNPAFVNLSEAAGGADKVVAFCDELLASPSHGATTSGPGGQGTGAGSVGGSISPSQGANPRVK